MRLIRSGRSPGLSGKPGSRRRQQSPVGDVRLPAWWSGPNDREQLPRVADALQGVGPPVRETDPRTGYEVLDGSSDEHLARCRVGAHSGRDVHGDTAYVVPHHLALAGMEAGPNPDAPGLGRLDDELPRALDRPRL